MTGVTKNEENLCDRDFSVVAQDCYRLKRKVEMYQWTDTYHEAKGSEPAYNTYKCVWSQTPIDSTQFRSAGFDNPSLFSWPYRSNTI